MQRIAPGADLRMGQEISQVTSSGVRAVQRGASLLSALALLACGGTPPPADASTMTKADTSTLTEEAPAQEAAKQHEATPRHAHQAEQNHPHMGEHTQRAHHFKDPESYVAAWNDPERDQWQKPEEIILALDIKPGATVVDLGAGTGYLLPRLSTAVGPTGAVIAADIEPAMLSFIKEAAKREEWGNVRTHQSKPDDLALPAQSTDGVVTLNTWHHIEDREAYASRVFSALRTRAHFIVADFLAEPTEGFGPPLAMRLSAEQVAAELTAAGFIVEIMEETMPRHYIVRGTRPASEAKKE